ncbi:hypothetical protein [Cronobacter sakazakii]|uniref:hypothetical protein n=1 Tax=Cronobacter sakazakii TaxID=28141 RepID=UPI0013FD67BC|nr:hypothetical protein [Cronobacter sakazakii]MDQ1988423.1 hypothetical protein [Cronobacter sakazakii]MDQ9190464.1 hypothetical protein [Cronobacter sakazakii]MDT3657305.1 hypothetical protein [Cronobacter sakazakii]
MAVLVLCGCDYLVMGAAGGDALSFGACRQYWHDVLALAYDYHVGATSARWRWLTH